MQLLVPYSFFPVHPARVSPGAAALAEALGANRTLTALQLNSNDLRAEGCEKLAAGLRVRCEPLTDAVFFFMNVSKYFFSGLQFQLPGAER